MATYGLGIDQSQRAKSVSRIINKNNFLTDKLINIINCFSSIELHKTGHEMNHSDRTKTKQVHGFIVFVALS